MPSCIGHIPADISTPRLHALYVAYNQLSGSIPSGLLSLKHLRTFNANSNLLSGRLHVPVITCSTFRAQCVASSSGPLQRNRCHYLMRCPPIARYLPDTLQRNALPLPCRAPLKCDRAFSLGWEGYSNASLRYTHET